MNKSLLLFSAMLMLCFSSCKKEAVEEAQPIAQSFQLSFANENSGLGLALTNTEVTLTNKTTGNIIKAKADANGMVNFSSILPGNYAVVASLLVSAADYSTATGAYSATDVSFNGSIETNINSATGSLAITLTAGRLGDWVIKQIYYGGSNVSTGAIFRDQFIELYNNSNTVLYADSLYLAQVHGKNTRVSSIDISKPAFLPNGQFNWANAIGMAESSPNTNYVYAKTMYMIKGTGKQYPVQPGASIIIAQTAQNHKTPYIGADGVGISVKDPSLTVDLSKADFEAYYGDLPGVNPLPSDADNPNVPNLQVLRSDGRDMILNSNGYEAIVIFKTSANISQWKSYPDPEKTVLTNTTDLFTQIPVAVLIDGVDITHSVVTSRAAKRLPDAIDAGFTFTAGGSYSSQSVIRKTSKTAGTRRILKDTNNSSQDFDYLTMADATKSAFK